MTYTSSGLTVHCACVEKRPGSRDPARRIITTLKGYRTHKNAPKGVLIYVHMCDMNIAINLVSNSSISLSPPIYGWAPGFLYSPPL